MKKFVTILVIIGFSNMAFAASPIVGTWKMVKQECKSGSPAKPFGNNMSGTISAVGTFQENTYSATIHVDAKYDPAYRAQINEQIKAAKDLINMLPDGPEKQKSTEEIKKVEKFLADEGRVQCRVSMKGNYVLKGSTLLSTPVSQTSTCPGEGQSLKSSTDVVDVEFSDNMMKTATLMITEDDRECPAGDSTITTYKRVK